MALVWHDWFATGYVGAQRHSIRQADLFRRRGRGSFLDLLLAVTTDPAMLIWLSGIKNTKASPNENFARELMELFTLGASNDAGRPYSEDDVREHARALTGWRANYVDDLGLQGFAFDPSRHDGGRKTIFGQRGHFDWADSCRLCVQHRAHKTFFVQKLWSYFIPTPPPPKTLKALERLYLRKGHKIRPVVEAILMHPAFYRGPAMVKPPAVFIAGMLRARNRGIQSERWTYFSKLAGQRLFRPPNVSGWNDERWLDTSTFRGRWFAASEVAGYDVIDKTAPYAEEDPETAVANALRFWGDPEVRTTTSNELVRYAVAVEELAVGNRRSSYQAMRQNALRMLVATAPEQQTC